MTHDEELKKATAARLKEARESADYRSARAACDKFGWSYDAYSKHENGQRNILPALAGQYAAAFGVSPEYLLFGKTYKHDVGVESRKDAVAENGSHELASAVPDRVRRLEMDFTRLNEKLETRMAKLDAAGDMIAATRADISALHTLVAGANARLDRLEKRIERLEARDRPLC